MCAVRASGQYSGVRELPPEIWLKVFAYATHIPGALTHDDGQALLAFARDKHGISVHRRRREAADLMLSVSRVCKTWTPLVTEFLFQYLLIKSGDHAAEVATVLLRYGKDEFDRNLAGRWTLRLELALEGVHHWKEEHSTALATIFACCPNVMIFSTAFSTADALLFRGRRFLRAMRDVGTRSTLKRLELKGDADLFETTLPPLSSSLEALWLLPSRQTAPNRLVDPMHFPRIHTLIISDDFGWGGPPPTWTLPSLETLCAEGDNYGAMAQRKRQSFFDAHGARLQRLVVCRSALACVKSCTSLVEWTLSCGMLFPLTRLAPLQELLPPTIRILILTDTLSTTYVHHVVLLVEWLGAGLLPALQTIRFLLPLGRDITRQRPREDWEQAVELLQEAARQRGIRLEASIGGDEHTANIWTPFCVDQLLDTVDRGPYIQSSSAP